MHINQDLRISIRSFAYQSRMYEYQLDPSRTCEYQLGDFHIN